MAQTIRICSSGRYPSTYLSERLEQRRTKTRTARLERRRKPDKPEDFLCYSDSESEDDTPTQQEEVLRTSYNFCDYVSSREMQSSEVRRINPAYATRHILTHDMFREIPVSLGNINKIFCSQWLSDRQVVFGTKCNKLMVYDVNTRQLDGIPSLRTRQSWPGGEHQSGIHAVQINPSRSLLATVARNTCEVALYRLPTLDPIAVGEGHKDWVLGMCWLDDQFFVSGSRDTKIALWKANEEVAVPTKVEPDMDEIKPLVKQQPSLPQYEYMSPVIIKECRTGQKIRAITFNKTWNEIAALTLNGFIHVFAAETFKQKLSRKLPSCQDVVCLATQESGLYAIGCKSYTLLLDCRTLQSVKKITSRYNGCGIRSLSFQGDMLTIGTGVGMLMFYDLRAGRYLESNVHSSKVVVLKASKGYDFPEEEDSQAKQVPAIYTHCYDSSGTRVFAGGGPLLATLVGNYAAFWQ